jgi:alpha-beta hydrolase superfamily lysophospholipase
MKKTVISFLKIIVILYLLFCGTLYFYQEKLIFFPEKLDTNYSFSFEQKFEELNIKTVDGKLLNGLLFKATNSQGIIYYLHGNGGSLGSWGNIAKTYTNLNYDVFMLDYRGYGKSEGKISSQKQLFEDAQTVYNELKKRYKEVQIIVLGYSIGTGIASKLASNNQPKLLILQAPYYSLTDMMQHSFSYLPTCILKYKLATNIYLNNCNMPVIIFHGDRDAVIYYGSLLKLKAEFKPQDTLITLKGQGHNGMTANKNYRIALKKILSK